MTGCLCRLRDDIHITYRRMTSPCFRQRRGEGCVPGESTSPDVRVASNEADLGVFGLLL